jgi:hypothetical protein
MDPPTMKLKISNKLGVIFTMIYKPREREKASLTIQDKQTEGKSHASDIKPRQRHLPKSIANEQKAVAIRSIVLCWNDIQH